MKRTLAFVLGGGGSRGALQVGALKALLEAGFKPDMLVGTSIGAANSPYLALNGVDMNAMNGLCDLWQDIARAEIFTGNYLWTTMRGLFNRGNEHNREQLRSFLIAHGLHAELKFADINQARLYLVAADLNSCELILYGEESGHSVLEGILASTALPPWLPPLEIGQRYLVDGGVVSNLPVEPAVSKGATEIIALDLADTREPHPGAGGFWAFTNKLLNTLEKRQNEMEIEVATASHVPVRRIVLQPVMPISMWDFSHTDELIARGYELASREMANWKPLGQSWFQKIFSSEHEIYLPDKP
jgi:NTE family protein